MKRSSSRGDLDKFLYQLNHWETWNWFIKYIPMIPFWIVHCIRARSCWFFTASNPTLTFGGYEGESKLEMYCQLPAGTYPKTKLIQPSVASEDLAEILLTNNFSFPVAVKPDVGRMGIMFRKINTIEDLVAYHERMKADYLLQEFVHYPIEVSVFYYRFPHQKEGTITGFVKKEPLYVTGDGASTLYWLMLRYDRVRFRLDEMKTKHAEKLNYVLPAGERYLLSEALNLSRGGKLVSLEHEKDDQLRLLFDDISNACNFFFGRFDIKCRSVEDLKNRKHFSILEFNGSGAEPHHVYGNGNSLIQATRILLQHWNVLFQISVENYKRGVPYWNFARGLTHLKKSRVHFKQLRALELGVRHPSTAGPSTLKVAPNPAVLQPLQAVVKQITYGIRRDYHK